ncbi:MAG TPA: arylsulfatase [Pyrinomonadaceae bacterium]|jgi:arylsulfatase A-like enzyme
MVHHRDTVFFKLFVAAISALSLLLMQAVAPAQRGRREQRRPNIIFILADDLGYGDLGSYGQKFFKTPNLDRMAQEGLRLTQFYSGSPVCAPSRASFMTGLHQGHAYIRGNMDVNNQRVSLRPEDVTIAEVLKRAGYRTGVIGKWGLGEPDTTGVPNRQGFDYWFGYLNQNLAHNYYPDYLWRNNERVTLPRGTYSHDLFTQEALDFIRRERNGPFFLYLAYTIPHAHNELTKKTGNGMEVPTDAPYSNQTWPQPEKNYAAMIARMDTDAGKILALLKELNLDDETIVMFSSDNGPQSKDEGGYEQSFFDSNGPFRGIKRELYEGGVRVPLIVRWPGKIRAGQTTDYVAAQWYLLPTMARMAGVRPPAGIDGSSILPVLLGQRQTPDKYLYWEFHEGGFAQAARLGRWKAVRHGADGPIELYDLQTDVGETRDVAAQRPELVRRMAAIMRREHAESEHWPVSQLRQTRTPGQRRAPASVNN